MTKVARLFVLLALAGCAGGTEGSLSADDPIGPGLFVPGDVVSEQTAQELAFEHIQQDADMLAGVDGLEPPGRPGDRAPRGRRHLRRLHRRAGPQPQGGHHAAPHG
ncbi:MAG: hypothetical protein JRI25_12020 [Deltaproteobacteria bacterium]|nr:hypothetical protein [Deltaproteobacteria bacterium]